MSREYSIPTYSVLYAREEIRGTRRQGYVTTSYHHLVDLFGDPMQGDGRKIDMQWIIGTDAGIGTIYNYTPLYERTASVENLTHWNVGGKNKATYRTIVKIVQAHE